MCCCSGMLKDPLLQAFQINQVTIYPANLMFLLDLDVSLSIKPNMKSVGLLFFTPQVQASWGYVIGLSVRVWVCTKS